MAATATLGLCDASPPTTTETASRDRIAAAAIISTAGRLTVIRPA
jgi:hypothetical protein